MIKRICIVLLYVFYTVALVAVLLVVLFPKEPFLAWAAAKVEQVLPGYECSIEHISYEYPLQVRLSRISLVNAEKEVEIPIDTLVVDIEKKWPVKRVYLMADLYGGTAEAKVNADRKAGTVTFNELHVDALKLELIDFMQESLDRKLQGNLRFSGRLVLTGAGLSESRFTGAVKVENFHTELRRSVLGAGEFDFTEVAVDTALYRRQITLENGTFSGPLVAGNFAGKVNLQKPWQQSRLQIECGLQPQDALLKKDQKVAAVTARLYRKYQEDFIPCVIGGNVKFPQFRFGHKAKPRVSAKK